MTFYFLTKAPKEKKLRHIFKLLDEDRNGLLSFGEVVNVVKHAYDIHGQLDFDYNAKGLEIFEEMDTNNDINITQDEFVQACLKNTEISQLMEDLMGPLNQSSQ